MCVCVFACVCVFVGVCVKRVTNLSSVDGSKISVLSSGCVAMVEMCESTS